MDGVIVAMGLIVMLPTLAVKPVWETSFVVVAVAVPAAHVPTTAVVAGPLLVAEKGDTSLTRLLFITGLAGSTFVMVTGVAFGSMVAALLGAQITLALLKLATDPSLVLMLVDADVPLEVELV